ncbi:MAG: hypothetical protein ACYDCL_10915 [Myxococcales bacterium]
MLPFPEPEPAGAGVEAGVAGAAAGLLGAATAGELPMTTLFTGRSPTCIVPSGAKLTGGLSTTLIASFCFLLMVPRTWRVWLALAIAAALVLVVVARALSGVMPKLARIGLWPPKYDLMTAFSDLYYVRAEPAYGPEEPACSLEQPTCRTGGLAHETAKPCCSSEQPTRRMRGPAQGKAKPCCSSEQPTRRM